MPQHSSRTCLLHRKEQMENGRGRHFPGLDTAGLTDEAKKCGKPERVKGVRGLPVNGDSVAVESTGCI